MKKLVLPIVIAFLFLGCKKEEKKSVVEECYDEIVELDANEKVTDTHKIYFNIEGKIVKEEYQYGDTYSYEYGNSTIKTVYKYEDYTETKIFTLENGLIVKCYDVDYNRYYYFKYNNNRQLIEVDLTSKNHDFKSQIEWRDNNIVKVTNGISDTPYIHTVEYSNELYNGNILLNSLELFLGAIMEDTGETGLILQGYYGKSSLNIPAKRIAANGTITTEYSYNKSTDIVTRKYSDSDFQQQKYIKNCN